MAPAERKNKRLRRLRLRPFPKGVYKTVAINLRYLNLVSWLGLQHDAGDMHTTQIRHICGNMKEQRK
ncbi:Hypothetical predicted protein [Podarcis lilfordi]|uniref:Uncharacterized protein n=1 Tax=Podarcis lilfordi TaxID=74358 RepID=A0AA35PJ47_9SAUR|nr:Hypothetical predicted protein [Podarcis lilfordi]